MLSEKDLEPILQTKLPLLQVDDIHWRTEESTSHALLFYKLSEDPRSLQLFHQRLEQSQYAWIILNKDIPDRPARSSVCKEDRWPELQKKVLDRLYPYPEKIKLLAVTGTNGKTTTADLVLQMGEMIGKKGLSVGTLGVRENHKTLLDFGLTSPSYIDLRKFLYLYGRDKDFCVLEASSHALVQKRLYELKFEAAGWLSFSQDHLDYHKSMEEYFEAKALLFQQLKPQAKLFVPSEQQELISLLQQRSSQVTGAPLIEADLPIFFRTRFNRNNLEVAKAMIEEAFQTAISPNYLQLHSPDGRFYIRSYGSSYIIVDFAHSPDALKNICQAIREAFPGHHLKVLFGCGGDRDRSKRAQMATVVDDLADQIYVTSDNPRSENPDLIIDDILKGIRQKPYHREVDRLKAVHQAFAELGPQEVLLLAGKGHEDYLLINGVKHPYSDIKEVEKFLSRKNNDQP
jgi:UDP-N-acetylmuramoyl-L-alanyl-D-glutamate--2,6-diaminopimelate ligase